MKKILQSPITLLVSIGLGILSGLYLSIITPFLEPINNIYISLLQVCSLPIIICAITINIGKIFQRSFRIVLKKWIIFTTIVMIISGAIGVLVASGMSNFLVPKDEARVSLSKASDKNNEKKITESFSELEIYDENNISNENDFSLVDFLVGTIPENVFNALANNSTLQVVIFFMIFGTMLTFIDKQYSVPIIDLFEGINAALYKFMDVILLFLPLSVFIMMASLFSDNNMLSMLDSIFDFIIVNYIAITIFILLSFIIIAVSTKCSFKQHLHAMKRTFFVSIGTSSRSAVVPVTIEDSVKKMNLDETTVNSIIPIGTLLCPNGKILTSAVLAVYALIIYESPKNFSTLSIIVLGAILFSISISGISGAASVTMLSIMLQPIGLPTDVISIVLMTAVQFYQGVSTFAGIYSNLAVVSIIAPKKSKYLKGESKIPKEAAESVN